MSTAIVLFAHGSSVESANGAVRAVSESAALNGGFERVEVAFLDPVEPTLGHAVDKLAGQGFSRVLIVPYFLTLGLHLQRDLPRIVGEILEAHPGLEVRVTPPLDGHPALAGIVLDRAQSALGEWG